MEWRGRFGRPKERRAYGRVRRIDLTPFTRPEIVTLLFTIPPELGEPPAVLGEVCARIAAVEAEQAHIHAISKRSGSGSRFWLRADS